MLRYDPVYSDTLDVICHHRYNQRCIVRHHEWTKIVVVVPKIIHRHKSITHCVHYIPAPMVIPDIHCQYCCCYGTDSWLLLNRGALIETWRGRFCLWPLLLYSKFHVRQTTNRRHQPTTNRSRSACNIAQARLTTRTSSWGVPIGLNITDW